MINDPDLPELSNTELAQWNAMRQSIDALVDQRQLGTATSDDLSATSAQLNTIKLDMARVRDSLHIPRDAGEYGDALVGLMLRIPEGWGRWISCDAGWYPLTTQLDRELTAIAPGYTLNQVKEKYGRLCYYIDLPYSDDPQDKSWALTAERIRATEERAASTCERCSAESATLNTSRGWYKTLCVRCADFYNSRNGQAYKPLH